MLRSNDVKEAFSQTLAPALERRFGERLCERRHVSDPDPDTRRAGLPDHRRIPTRTGRASPSSSISRGRGQYRHRHHLPRAARRRQLVPKRTQMRFAPNTGYAFAVGDDTWHSADPVHDRVKTRDSILLTYFVDAGPAALPAQPRQAGGKFRPQRGPQPPLRPRRPRTRTRLSRGHETATCEKRCTCIFFHASACRRIRLPRRSAIGISQHQDISWPITSPSSSAASARIVLAEDREGACQACAVAAEARGGYARGLSFFSQDLEAIRRPTGLHSARSCRSPTGS